MGFAAGPIDEKFRNSCSTPICSPELHAEVEELSTAVSAGTYATEGADRMLDQPRHSSSRAWGDGLPAGGSTSARRIKRPTGRGEPSSD